MIHFKKMRNPIRFLVLCMVLLSVSCQHEDGIKTSQPGSLKPDDYRYKILDKNGLDMTNATIVKDGILVEDDMVIPFAAFDSLEEKKTSGRIAQYDIGGALLLTPANGVFYVFVDEASFTDPIFSEHIVFAVDDAITDYNGFCTFILMDRTVNRAQASLVVTNGTLGAGVYGQSAFPFGGKVGATMIISEANMTSIGATSESGCRRVVSHEMGHTLGLRHSDWNQTLSHTERRGFWPFYYTITVVDQYPEPQDGVDQTTGQAVSAVLVPGTPVSDPGSIMNRLKYQEAVVFNGFSDFDKLTMQTLYPPAIPCTPPCPLPYPQITSYTVDGVSVQNFFGVSPGTHSLVLQAAGNPSFTFSVMYGNLTINSSSGGYCGFNYGGGDAGFKVTMANNCYSTFVFVSMVQR